MPDAASAWADAQRHFLDQLWAPPSQLAPQSPLWRDAGLGARGWQAYRAHAQVLAPQVLQAAYPVLAQWLGAEAFEGLARHYWHLYPPQRGDLALWGETLPEFLHVHDTLDDRALLADLARVEWSLHRAATAADAEPDPASFQSLVDTDPDALRLVFAPGTVLCPCIGPVAALIDAHAAPDVSAALSALAERLPGRLDAHPEVVLVWREGWRPRSRALDLAELPFVKGLLDEGCTLGQALGRTPPGFDFAAWLARAVHSGWLCAVAR